MRMHHRLYNPRGGRRANVRKTMDWIVGTETVHINKFTKEPDFIYYIKEPSVKGDRYDYQIKSLGGMELKSGSAENLKKVKEFVLEDLEFLTKQLTEERLTGGKGGAFEAQTYTDVDPLYPGQWAKSPAKEYTGFEIVVRREYADSDEPHGYYYYASSTDGEYETPTVGRVPSRGEAEARAHMAAGLIAGMREVADSNPATRKKFGKWVIRKGNPLEEVMGGRKAFGKRSVTASELEEMPKIIGIPHDSNEAALFGYYMGVLRGLKTCGITKIYERYKIRKRIRKLLDEQMHELAEVAIGKRGKAPIVTVPYSR